MIRYTWTYIVIILLLQGCTNTNTDYNFVRNNPETKVKTLSTLAFKNISIDKENEVKLGNGDNEVIDLDGNRVFASKLILPEMNTPFSLDVRSSSTAGFFAPKIFFLDELNQIVRTVEAKNLQFDRGFYKGTIFINTEYSKINSIVVTQDIGASKSQHNIKYVSGGVLYVPIGLVMVPINFSSGDLNKTLEYSYGGTIKFILKAYKPAVLGVK